MLDKKIWKDRYSHFNEESWEDTARRIANYVAEAEKDNKEMWQTKFYYAIANKSFIPGGRIMSNAGRPNGQLLNCFVIPLEDSRESIGEMLKNYLMISGTGGGVGISFSKLRPKGAPITTNGGDSSGPIPFMDCVDQVASTIKVGGQRRAATMISLSARHPNLEDFIHHKLDLAKLTNANVSIEADHAFFEAIRKNKPWDLVWGGKTYKTIEASTLWNKLVENAHKSGEPGVLNLGLMRQQSNSYYFNEILTTNPCGEQPLPAFGSCCLGSINLDTFVEDKKFNYAKFTQIVDVAIRFLDNVLDVNCYPLPEIRQVAMAERRIGLGVMGLHYALLRMGIKYSSEEAVEFTERIYKELRDASYITSAYIAEEKGSFHKFDKEMYLRSGFTKHLPIPIRRLIKERGMRNVCCNTQAPTGTTSMVAGVSSGIEPLYAPLYKRRFNSSSGPIEEIVADPICSEGAGIEVALLEGALDIPPEHHLKIQEAAQKYLDSAVSKTINLPENYKINNLSDILLKYADDLKGTTIYRSGSRGKEPLTPLEINDTNLEQAKKQEQAEQQCKTGSCEI